ncbi:MAG: M56 family metallopeptidase [Lachnospiraceae bacterium]|nr:M56 family metallopeptidase [Lachnospiraceae bacterium]MCM1215664.1 M56 family metallopeptidase [Lachnospiraceae bacterium]MCM1238467.1 M56 family metallopeptidase [Lachnospiraceae bacterium]
MMMTNFFLAVFEISLSISALIAVLLLLTPFFNKRYAAKWKYWIWIFFALRLLIPLNGADVKNMMDPWQQAGNQVSMESEKNDAGNPWEQTVTQGRIIVEIPAQMATPVMASSEKDITLLDIAAFVWMMGGMAFLAVHLVSYACYRRRVLKRGTDIRDNEILCQLFQLKHELRIRDTVRVVEYPEAASPMVIGFLEPVLILPEVRYSPEELYFILKHELIHLKRRDVYVKLLLAAANAVHWFNPLVWIMQKEAAVDMELSCDERVTQGTDYEVRKAYTETLLSTLHKRHAGKMVLSTQFYGGKQVMKKRFKNILLRTGKKNGAVIFLCAAVLTVSLGTLVGCSVARDDVGSGNAEDASVQLENGNTVGQAGNAGGGSGNAESGHVAGQEENTEGDFGSGQSPQSADGQAGSTDAANAERLVYIENFDGKTLAFDEVEWVEVPGERAVELGLTEDDAPSGFSVYNEDAETEELNLADNCVCTLLDWIGNYAEMQVTPEELAEILTQRDAPGIPYHLTVEGNEITGISEQYVP